MPAPEAVVRRCATKMRVVKKIDWIGRGCKMLSGRTMVGKPCRNASSRRLTRSVQEAEKDGAERGRPHRDW